MKISYNWLRQYISLDSPPEELSGILTGIGLEVESLEQVDTVQGGMRGIVVGEVKSCTPHPDADKLTLTRVDVGEERLLDIVCGAPNVAEGQKVAVALPGATLHTPGGTLEIRSTRIRGQVSEGMICAEDELGLGTSHSGILVLAPDASPGMPAAEYFRVESDSVFEIAITPNRIDSGSHFGAARDLFAYFSIRKPVTLFPPDTGAFGIDNHDLEIPVEILDPKACPRYTGVTISGVRVEESPAWLKNRLLSIGQSPINNVVDITNFVLHELGQPLHAFDADRIKGGKVVVRTLPEGSRFTTLDGIERILSGEDLMICNAEEGMCIGGVFGGTGSGVTGSTRNVFLESAYFDPVHIRKTAKRHGLNTDASFRFERGADPSMTLTALKRAAMMIREIAGGKISSAIVDVHPVKIEDPLVDLSFRQVERLTGIQIDPLTIEKILVSLGMEIVERSAGRLRLRVPAYRVDVTREADLIEEILRIYGYEQISYDPELHSSLSFSTGQDKEKLLNTVSDLLVGHGFFEIMQNSLSSISYYRDSEVFPEKFCVRLQNPLSSDLSVMRQTLLFGGLEAVRYNTNRQHPDNRFFEFGNIYRLITPSARPGVLDSYNEEERFCLWMTGNHVLQHWTGPQTPTTFFHLKSYAELILNRLGIDPGKLRVSELHNNMFHEGLQYQAGKELLLELGEIHPQLLMKSGLDTKLYYADLRWAVLLSILKDRKIRFTEIPRFPEVRRDLALLVDQDVRFSQIAELAGRTEKTLLKKIDLFDVYEGKQTGQGKKSYAVSFILQDTGKTLTDKRIDEVMKRLISAFASELNAAIR